MQLLGGQLQRVEHGVEVGLGAQVQAAHVEHTHIALAQTPLAAPVLAVLGFGGGVQVQRVTVHAQGHDGQLWAVGADRARVFVQPGGFVVEQALDHGLHRLAGADLCVPRVDGRREHVGQPVLDGQFAAGVGHAHDAEPVGLGLGVASAHPRHVGHLGAGQVGGADFCDAVDGVLRQPTVAGWVGSATVYGFADAGKDLCFFFEAGHAPKLAVPAVFEPGL